MTDPEISSKLAVSTRHLRELRALGHLPAAGTPLLAVALAYIVYLQAQAKKRPDPLDPSPLDRQRERLAQEQADQLAIRNAATRGDLVPIEPITSAVIGMIEIAKGKLKRVGAKVAQGDAGLKARINSAIEDALLDLSATGADAVLKRLAE